MNTILLAIAAALITTPVLAAEPASRTSAPGLTIEEAWRRTEAADPELAAMASELRVLEARREQAGRLANPELSVMAENILGTGTVSGMKGAETTIAVSQSLPMTRRLSLASGSVEAEQERLKAEILLRKRAIAANLIETFVEVLGHGEHVEHSGQTVLLVEKFARAATERVRAGAAPAAEELRAETVLRDARVQLRKGELDLEASRHRLALFWSDGQTDTGLPVAPISKLPDALPGLEPLIARLGTVSVDPIWEKERDAREKKRDLERSQALPDFRLEAGYRRLNASNDHAAVAGIWIPIPVFNRNQGAVREAGERLERIPQEQSRMRKRLTGDLINAYANLQVHHEEAVALRDELLPKTREALDLLLDGYRRGRFGLIDVTDVERRLYELLERYHDALVGFHQAAAVIESLTAEPLYPESITFVATGEIQP